MDCRHNKRAVTFLKSFVSSRKRRHIIEPVVGWSLKVKLCDVIEKVDRKWMLIVFFFFWKMM